MPPIGMMLEVPAAAVTIELMLPLVDFVSIGSNDLVQYLMAADRDNPKVSHLCDPLAPAVLRVLSAVITSCRKYNTPVTLCGEMAGRPRSFVLLLGMGLFGVTVLAGTQHASFGEMFQQATTGGGCGGGGCGGGCGGCGG